MRSRSISRGREAVARLFMLVGSGRNEYTPVSLLII